MMKISVKKAACRIEFDYYLKGSVLKETVEAGCDGMRTHFTIESDAPREKVTTLVRTAKRGCFAENLIKKPVAVSSRMELNGVAVPSEEIS